MTQPILQAQSLHKSYGKTEAVRGISFDIQPGEIFSLLGPNGAGKTTTISMLSCLLEPTQGDALIDGHSIRSQASQVKAVIGVVPQEIALYPDMGAMENLRFWGRMYGLGGALLRQRCEELLDTVGLADRAKDKVETFSGGMKRRLNIAVGLLHKPKVLYMDEPTVGIDPQSRRRILDTVLELNRQGLTVLYTTHYMEEAAELSNRIGIVDHGQLIALGSQVELTKLVGQVDTLRIGLDPEGLEQTQLLDAVHKVKRVQRASLENGQLLVQAEGGHAALGDIVACINQAQARLLDLRVDEPNLEAVFLHLTGRALRD